MHAPWSPLQLGRLADNSHPHVHSLHSHLAELCDARGAVELAANAGNEGAKCCLRVVACLCQDVRLVTAPRKARSQLCITLAIISYGGLAAPLAGLQSRAASN
jgi:hypothetical protein